ncbi:MAG: acyltransferase [Bacteroidia bacterium]|nr:acyltransferase [Bacteroidia bacterium]
MTTQERLLYPILPGEKIPGDWYPGAVPLNIKVGENTVADSSFCFKHYYSGLPTGLKIGNNVTLWRTSLAAEENAFIEIGDYCYISNASLVCSERISIGNYVFIAGGVTIADSDFHPITPASRLADTIALSPLGNRKNRPIIKTLPVVIEDDVWIGFNATILKGVHIGAGAIIQPGAFVIVNVAPGTIVSGNPAKKIAEVT